MIETVESTLAGAVGAWHRGQRGEAERLARAVIARDQHQVDAHRLLLELHTAAERVPEAIAAARSVIRLAPRDAAAHRRLAELLSRGGDAAAAVTILERSLEIEPDNVRALNNLGHLLTGLDRIDAAIDVLSRALSRQPDHSPAWVNLGVAHVRSGRLDQAVDCYRRALALNPRFPEAWLHLANAHRRTNDLASALDCYEQARACRRPGADALIGRGEVYLLLKRCEEALASFDDALQSTPSQDAALLGRVHALLGLKRADEALAACEALLARPSPPREARGLRATALLALDRIPEALAAAQDAAAAEPDDAQAFISLGYAALRSATPQLALSAFEKAALLQPAIAKVHAGRGNALEVLGRAAEAIDAYEEAARLDPADPKVLLNSGSLMLRLGYGTGAVAAFDAVLARHPDFTDAKVTRAAALLALGRHEEAVEAYLDLASCAPTLDYLAGNLFYSRLCCCDWSGYEAISADIVARVCRGERAELPLSFMAHATDPEAQRRCVETYAADSCKAGAATITNTGRTDGTRLRVAYLSFDFRNHPVAQLTAGLFEAHDRSRFETYGLCAATDDRSDLRRRLSRAFERFEDVSDLPDQAVAQRIADLGIDILVDLGGHTLGSRTRVLAHRPAPVQISFLGFPGTTGGGLADYLVADRHVIPAGEQDHYAEQIIYMPDTYLPTDFAPPLPASPSRAEAGLPEDAIVFCCFNAPFKITPAAFEGWMRVLEAVPAGVLWLREASAAMRRNLAREAAAQGVAEERLIYASRVPTAAEHLARFALADIFLDTTPYNAHTTASEALAAGVPVVTLRGRTFASRVATSVLHAVGLGHLSVESAADYERVAIGLARSPTALADVKAHLHRLRRTAPLFDTVRFCRHLEDAFLEIDERRRRGERPTPLHVRPRSAAMRVNPCTAYEGPPAR